LRKWRAARGNLGQAALSRKAGLPFHAVGSLERGARAVDLREIARLCGALDMAVPVFLQDLHRSLLEALQPLLQNLRDGTYDGDELNRAVDRVAERAEQLLSSMTGLAGEQGPGPERQGPPPDGSGP
jgi:hypothetical protein